MSILIGGLGGPASGLIIGGYGVSGPYRVILEAVRRAARYAPVEFELMVRRVSVKYGLRADTVRAETFGTDLKANTLGQEMTILVKILASTLVPAEFRTKLVSSVSIPFSVAKVIISDTIVPNIIGFAARANTLVRGALSLPVRGIRDMRRLIMEIVLEEEEE